MMLHIKTLALLALAETVFAGDERPLQNRMGFYMADKKTTRFQCKGCFSPIEETWVDMKEPTAKLECPKCGQSDVLNPNNKVHHQILSRSPDYLRSPVERVKVLTSDRESIIRKTKKLAKQKKRITARGGKVKVSLNDAIDTLEKDKALVDSKLNSAKFEIRVHHNKRRAAAEAVAFARQQQREAAQKHRRQQHEAAQKLKRQATKKLKERAQKLRNDKIKEEFKSLEHDFKEKSQQYAILKESGLKKEHGEQIAEIMSAATKYIHRIKVEQRQVELSKRSPFNKRELGKKLTTAQQFRSEVNDFYAPGAPGEDF